MNALVKKEIRLLLPAWIVAMLLAIFPIWIQSTWSLTPDDSSIFSSAFVLGVLFLGLASFGQEFSAKTFTLLLSQPMQRQRIWLVKIYTLAAAFGLVSLALFISWKILALHLGWGDWFYRFGAASQFEMIVMFGLAVLCGGLWTTLLLRQIAAAFWFTLLVPAALNILILLVAGYFNSGVTPKTQAVLLLVYSIAGIFWAHRLFLRAQDVAWTGGNIAMPEMRGLARFKIASDVRRIWRPRAALLAKEFQLHLSLFIMAGALLALHLGIIATRKFGHFQINSVTEFVLESFWLLWLVMPLLAGAAAVAEERKLGTLEGQLCLPVRRRKQFAVKAGVVLALSLFSGVAMPLLLEGTRILPDVHLGFNPVTAITGAQSFFGWQLHLSPVQLWFWRGYDLFSKLLPLLTLAGIAAAIGVISFYASTLTRNTLQALAPAVLGLLLTCFLLFAAALPENFGFHIQLPWRGWLIYFIGVPVLVGTLVAMAAWNFQRIHFGWQVCRRNALAFGAALAFVVAATTAIYHRVWEKLTPFEPPHGVARLSLSNPTILSEQWETIFVRLPDGRIWTDYYTLDATAPNPLALLFLGDFSETHLGGGHFLTGSNWVSVIFNSWREQVGIKTDGSLWVSESPRRTVKTENSRWKVIEAGSMVRFGSETNWSSSVVQDWPSMLLVKNDGTLWRWGIMDWNSKRGEWPGLQSFTPQRLGTESNWVEVFQSGYQPWLRKTDGSLWTRSLWTRIQDRNNKAQKIELDPALWITRSPLSARNKWRSTTEIRSGLDYRLGIRDDGTFRIWADQKLNTQSHSFEWTGVDLQFGKDTNWLAVAGCGEKVVTLKDDGTLWLWGFYHDWRRGWNIDRDERAMLDIKPVRLGTHTDWIAIASSEGGIVSLAADGSLWYWPLERAHYIGHLSSLGNGYGSHFEPLLDISRKPQLLGNVFGKAD